MLTYKNFGLFLLFTTETMLMIGFCRKWGYTSQQVGEDFGELFGIRRFSPYLCIVIKSNHIPI